MVQIVIMVSKKRTLFSVLDLHSVFVAIATGQLWLSDREFNEVNRNRSIWIGLNREPTNFVGIRRPNRRVFAIHDQTVFRGVGLIAAQHLIADLESKRSRRVRLLRSFVPTVLVQKQSVEYQVVLVGALTAGEHQPQTAHCQQASVVQILGLSAELDQVLVLSVHADL